jgi:hypothetical protein
MGQLLQRQQGLEAQINNAVQSLEAMYELARDAPSTLRTQAKAFSAAAVSFEQAAQVMNLQADLLERAAATLNTPVRLLRSPDRSGSDAAPPA